MQNKVYHSHVSWFDKINILVEYCSFSNIVEKGCGGAFFVFEANSTICHSVFSSCNAKAGGALELRSNREILVEFCLFEKNSAERVGAAFLDGYLEGDSLNLSYTNFSQNKADFWAGATRIQHNCGLVTNCFFTENFAEMYSAVFDYSGKPSYRKFFFSSFIDNLSQDRGAAFAGYRMVFECELKGCIFLNNKQNERYKGDSILIEGDSSILVLENSYFSGTLIKKYKSPSPQVL